MNKNSPFAYNFFVYPYAIAYSLSHSLANQVSMTLDYYLAYLSSAFLASARIKSDAHIGLQFNEPYLSLQEEWVRTTDKELHKYLKSPSFNGSLADFYEWLMEFFELTKTSSGPLSAFVSGVDKYWSEVPRLFLELQETPHEVVLRSEDIRLLHYLPSRSLSLSSAAFSKKNMNTPLLVIYSPENRYHIMDIRKGRSIIEQFTKEGFNVFLLDWGKQGSNMPSMSDYVWYIDQCVKEIKEITGVEKLSLLGYSWGGVLSMIYASSDSGQENIKNLVLESAHVDFYKDDSILASWFRNLPIDKITQNFDAIDGRFINLALIMRNPIIHVYDPMIFATSMSEKRTGVNAQFWYDVYLVSAWLTDTPVIPSRFFNTLIKHLYQQNQLVNKQLKLNIPDLENKNNPYSIIDLEKIAVPLLNIIGDFDDICPPSTSMPIVDIVSAKDKSTIRSPCGHIELCVSTYAHEKLWPSVVKWLIDRD